MKKIYIIPSARFINLATEESVLLSMSKTDGPGEVEGGMTREQYIDSPWDNWNE